MSPAEVETAAAAAGEADLREVPVVIEARDLEKVFRIPEHRIDTFKERALHPFSGPDFRELRALDGVSFDVGRGEFFGIVGRNGSGKSTLLKILASIYRSDSGSVRMAGRLAPFIELGVGFNPELTRARERRPQRRDDGPHTAPGAASGWTRCSSSPSSRTSPS